jgi:hypothetical protein
LCRKNKISRGALWIGFMGMFCGQLFLNITPHAQESPDNSAFFIGMLTIYFFISKSFRGMLGCLFLAAFLQPQLKIIMLPLILFYDWKLVPGQVNGEINSSNFFKLIINKFINRLRGLIQDDRKHFVGVIIFFSLVFSCLAGLSLFVVKPYFGTDFINVKLLPISIAFQSIFLGYALYKLNVLSSFAIALEEIFNPEVIRRLIYSVIVIVITAVIVSIVARGEILSLNSTFKGRLMFIYTFLQQSIGQPGMGVVIHLTFYGPLIALFCLLWSRIAIEAKKMGPGLVIAVALVLMLSNGTESRHLVAFLPWFTMILCISTKEYTSIFFLVVAVLQFIASRIYAPYRGDYENSSDPYLMIWGPWIAPFHYLDYVSAGIIGFALIMIALKYNKV